MTANVNNTEATADVDENGYIVLTVNGETLTLTADQVTALTTVALAARKEAYGVKRTANEAARKAAKVKRDEAKAARAKAAEAKRAEQLKKLEAKVAELKKSAKKAA